MRGKNMRLISHEYIKNSLWKLGFVRNMDNACIPKMSRTRINELHKYPIFRRYLRIICI